MAKIIHQEMRPTHTITQTASVPQNYVVEDLSGEQSTGIDQRLAAFVEQMPRPEERKVPEIKQEISVPELSVPEDEKKQLEKIIFMGRHSKLFEIAGHKFELSTITHKENSEIMARLMKIGEAVDLFTVRVITLAKAMRAIDEVKLEDVVIEGEFESELDHNISLIDNMQVALVLKLYKNYEDLVKENDTLVYGEAIKN